MSKKEGAEMSARKAEKFNTYNNAYNVFIFLLLLFFSLTKAHAKPELDMNEYINKHFVLVITIPAKTAGGRADLALVKGVMAEKNGSYILNTAMGEITLAPQWRQKIQPMKPEYVNIFGNADFFFPVPENEFNEAGYSYSTNPSLDKKIEVVD